MLLASKQSKVEIPRQILKGGIMKRYLFLWMALAWCAGGAAGQKPRTALPRKTPAASRAERPKFKGIFEPVNYDQDVKLFSVYCADDKNCWAAGGTSETRGGVLIHTTDAGAHWTLQAGDPQSDDYAFRDLRFVNEHLGFAVQPTASAFKLYRTEDGEHWLPVGKIDERDSRYFFTTATNGVAAARETIESTQDAGQTWKPVTTCVARVKVNGLTRNVGCQFTALSFPSVSTGYIAAKSYDTNENTFLAKTTDGGATWSILTLDVHDPAADPEDLCFVDDNTGFMRVGAADTGKIYKTTDGGKTWTAIAGSAGDVMRFSDDKHAGWAFHYSHFGFTGDAGERWSSRQVGFPASPLDSILPRANFGMVVGEHGMIYRYRIVPFEYTSEGMMGAPMLGAARSK
jgi:photosystem II stability/assembly factor-like uncharacterized protein